MQEIRREPRTGEEEKVFAKDMRITMAIPYKYIGHGIPDLPRWTLIQFERMAEATAKAGYEVFVDTDKSTSNTPVTRTKIVESFKGDWLLMMDADAFPEPDTANKLLAAAKADPDNLKYIVAVPAVRTSMPHLSCFCSIGETGLLVPWRYGIEFGDEEVDAPESGESCCREVDGSGFHCVLIHRKVFEAVPWPWFTLNVPDPDTGVIYGHDYTFCREAKRRGFQTYIEFACRVGHYGLKPFTIADNRAVVKAYPQEAENQKHLDVDVDERVMDDDNIDHAQNLFIPDLDKGKKEREIGERLIEIPKEALE